MVSEKISIGSRVEIPVGTKVTKQGITEKRSRAGLVTVQDLHLTKAGNMKITWKSHGYMATAIIKAKKS